MLVDPDVAVEAENDVNVAGECEEVRFEAADENWGDSYELAVAELRDGETRIWCEVNHVPCRISTIGCAATLHRRKRMPELQQRADLPPRRTFSSGVRHSQVSASGKQFRRQGHVHQKGTHLDTSR